MESLAVQEGPVGLSNSASALLRRQTVLLVDDEVDILDSLKLVLETFLRDVDVRVAESGAAALEVLASEPVDLVVSDYKMPEMDGLTFLREAHQRWPQVPRILVTAYPQLDIALRAIKEASIENFVTKPFDSQHFLAVVAAVLYERRAAELRSRALARSLELFVGRLRGRA
jgi:DNA-binding NtrC family response regulator